MKCLRICVLGVAFLAPLLCMPMPSRAQNALWSLTLANPIQSVLQGSSGTTVYNGTITNTDTASVLNLSGDSFSTGTWDPTLSISEDPSFTNFLLNTGFLNPGNSYSGALFDISYTSATPANNYTGSFSVNTDGSPNTLTSNFGFNVQPNASTPEAGTLWGLTGLLLGCGGVGWLRRRMGAITL